MLQTPAVSVTQARKQTCARVPFRLSLYHHPPLLLTDTEDLLGVDFAYKLQQNDDEQCNPIYIYSEVGFTEFSQIYSQLSHK